MFLLLDAGLLSKYSLTHTRLTRMGKSSAEMSRELDISCE